MNERLKEMFKERITSFRESVYLLTGYKVENPFQIHLIFSVLSVFLFYLALSITVYVGGSLRS